MFRNLLLSILFIISTPLSAQESDFILKIGTSELYIPAFRTYFSSEYVAPEKNLVLLRNLKPKISAIHVIDFAANTPGVTTIWCRGSYPVFAPEKIPYEIFLAGAIKNELTKADMYSIEAGIPLSIDLKVIDFESTGDAKWTIEATFSVPGKNPVTIKNQTPFEISFGASRACGQVKTALVPSIQDFLFKTYSNSKFQELFK